MLYFVELWLQSYYKVMLFMLQRRVLDCAIKCVLQWEKMKTAISVNLDNPCHGFPKAFEEWPSHSLLGKEGRKNSWKNLRGGWGKL